MFAILTTSMLALAAAAAPAADPLAPIAVYQGEWRAEIRRLDTEFSKAGPASRTIRNDCRRSGVFYTCAQTVDGQQSGLVIYVWEPAARAYGAYSVPIDGGPASKGTLLIDGDTWYFPWDQPADGVTIHVRVVNHFVGRDRIEYRREYSRDGERWTPMEIGIEYRLAP